MYLSFHGGNCCGIKSIYSLPMSPEGIVPKRTLKSLDVFYDERTQYPRNAGKQTPCDVERPEENGIQRLDFYLSWLSENRPGGLVEIALAEYQVIKWKPLLLERGFSQVTSFINSNSYTRVTVFHKVYENLIFPRCEDEDEFDPFIDDDEL
jgi:hypothetical protein